jgi:GDP-D-mannose dehydratase
VEPIAPCGNATKAKNMLGWTNQLTLPEIMERLVSSELAKLA